MVRVSFLLSFAVLITLAYSDTDYPAAIHPFGDVRNCPVKSPQDDNQPLYQMEVLPGIGFDNLRNLDMGQVHDFAFTKCQVSKDGKYLLPDGVFLLPVQESHVNAYAEYLDHWDDYTSMTSSSINLDAGYFSVISGKFSSGYSSTKTHMHNDKAKSTRTQIRNKLYTVKLQPGASLHPNFKSRLYDIASSIQNNNTEYAHYLSELLVRDYGTHYISSMDAGAILSQMDFVRAIESVDKYQYAQYMKASASANFFKKLSLGASFEHGKGENGSTGFVTNRTSSQVVTVGGPPFRPNMTLDEWEDGVPNALVGIDRSGDPLHFVINPTTLPRLPETTVRMLANHVQRAINRYYKVNTHPGCTDPSADNFNFQANLNNGICSPPSTNFTFGGIFQKCTPDPNHITENLCTGGTDPALQNNFLTGDLSCPPEYTAVLLHSGAVTHVTQKPVCNRVCKHCGWFSRCCHCESVLAPFLSIAHYEAYWCAALPGVAVPQNEGYLFGGFFTSKVSNPITGAMTCPRFFYPLHMGEDIKVCVSTDYERGFAYALDFGGLESCSVGNPLADSKPNDHNKANWPHACPHGYAQHLVAVEDGCEINFCVRAGALQSTRLLAPKLPPYRKHPKYKNNITDTLAVFGVYGEVWVKGSDGGWNELQSDSEDGQSLLSRISAEFPSNSPQLNNDSGSGLDAGAIAIISIVVTVVMGVLVAVVVLTGRWAYKHRSGNRMGRGGYTDISGEQPPTVNNSMAPAEGPVHNDEAVAVPLPV